MSGSSQTCAGDRRPDMVAFLAILVTAVLVVQAAPPADTVSLAVPGRSNSTPSVAAAGSFVAVAWGASSAGNRTSSWPSATTVAELWWPVQVNTVLAKRDWVASSRRASRSSRLASRRSGDCGRMDHEERDGHRAQALAIARWRTHVRCEQPRFSHRAQPVIAVGRR